MPTHVPLQGASNFRDFGGYKGSLGTLQSGRLFRSDRLSALNASDGATLEELGINLVIDLRRGSEVQEHPTRWPVTPAPELWHVPVFEDGADHNTLQQLVSVPEARRDPTVSARIMVQIYRSMILDPGPRAQFRRIFERLAADGAPTLLAHCSGGKDRTGVFAALVQGVLGVHRDDIVADYLLTDRYYDGLANIEARTSQIFEHEDFEFSIDAMVPIFSARQEYLEAALSEVEQHYGDIEGFVTQGLEISPDMLQKLRAALIVD